MIHKYALCKLRINRILSDINNKNSYTGSKICISKCSYTSTPIGATELLLYELPAVHYMAFYIAHIFIYVIGKSQNKGRVPLSTGTALQAGRWRVRFLMVSLEFFIDTTLPAALWPWV